MAFMSGLLVRSTACKLKTATYSQPNSTTSLWKKLSASAKNKKIVMLTTFQILRSGLIRNGLRQKRPKSSNATTTASLPNFGNLDPNFVSHEQLYQYSIQKVFIIYLRKYLLVDTCMYYVGSRQIKFFLQKVIIF